MVNRCFNQSIIIGGIFLIFPSVSIHSHRLNGWVGKIPMTAYDYRCQFSYIKRTFLGKLPLIKANQSYPPNSPLVIIPDSVDNF